MSSETSVPIHDSSTFAAVLATPCTIGEGFGDRLGCGWDRGRDADAFGAQLPDDQVDGCAFDPRSADVDPERSGGLPRMVGLHGSVSISAPCSVTRRVCSNWAVRLRSAVTTVHPSSHTSHASVPRVSIGSMVKTIPVLITVS